MLTAFLFKNPLVIILKFMYRKSEDLVRPKITLQSCFEAMVRPEEIQNFYSSAINGKTTASKYIISSLEAST